jgi:hypothetical protein
VQQVHKALLARRERQELREQQEAEELKARKARKALQVRDCKVRRDLQERRV